MAGDERSSIAAAGATVDDGGRSRKIYRGWCTTREGKPRLVRPARSRKSRRPRSTVDPSLKDKGPGRLHLCNLGVELFRGSSEGARRLRRRRRSSDFPGFSSNQGVKITQALRASGPSIVDGSSRGGRPLLANYGVALGEKGTEREIVQYQAAITQNPG